VGATEGDEVKNPERYTVTLTFDVDIARELLDASQEEDWQSQFYRMPREEVAGMIGRWLQSDTAVNQLDGFADRDPGEARMVPRSLDVSAERL
jgi:hypothetical protein